MADGSHREVWKYALDTPVSEFDVPEGGQVLHVAAQHGIPTVWVMVEPKRRPEKRTFVGFGTGHPIGETNPIVYLGTAHDVENAGLVIHVFERVAVREES